ncbi:hypothetical protein KCP71_25605 [Salmonella enterica subsp. enterica]|nr:hypothetical protein KCP71_25605 [Salmonella enterica subsp. enterica]
MARIGCCCDGTTTRREICQQIKQDADNRQRANARYGGNEVASHMSGRLGLSQCADRL